MANTITTRHGDPVTLLSQADGCGCVRVGQPVAGQYYGFESLDLTTLRIGKPEGEKYKVYTKGGAAKGCECPDRKYGKLICKHMSCAQAVLNAW